MKYINLQEHMILEYLRINLQNKRYSRIPIKYPEKEGVNVQICQRSHGNVY